MNSLQSSLENLRKYLEETPEQEKSKIWSEVKQIGISGPTVSEYLDGVQNEMDSFTNSFQGAPISIYNFEIIKPSNVILTDVSLIPVNLSYPFSTQNAGDVEIWAAA